MYEVSLIPIVIAAIANLIIGFIWYNPNVLGKIWARGAGLTDADMEAGKKRMPITVVVSILGAMLIAYVMNHFGIVWGVFDVIGAIELGIWTWLGFAMVPLLGSKLWEGRPLSYFAINAGYWLVSFVVIAIVLVLFAA